MNSAESESTNTPKADPLQSVALADLIEAFDKRDPANTTALYPSDFEVKVTVGSVEVKFTLKHEKSDDQKWNVETWTGSVEVNDLLSFGTAVDGTGADQWYVPKALLEFDVSLRRIGVEVRQETAKDNKQNQNWSVVTTFFGNKAAEKYAQNGGAARADSWQSGDVLGCVSRLYAEKKAVLPGVYSPVVDVPAVRGIEERKESPEVSESPFAVVGVGKNAGKNKMWSALSLRPALRITTRKPPTGGEAAETQSTEVAQVSLAVPVLTEVLKAPLGLDGVRLWHTREREDIPDGFVETFKAEFGVDPDKEKPTYKDIRDGLMLQLAMLLGVASHNYQVCLYGRGEKDKKPPVAGSGTQTDADSQDVAGAEKVARKFFSFRFEKLSIALDGGDLVISPQFACQMGPLDVVIAGLDISIPMGARTGISFTLRELGVGIDTSCITLQGGLGRNVTRTDDKDQEEYAGQILVRIGIGKFNLTISALGAYFVDHQANTKGFFVYAVVAVTRKSPVPAGPFQLTAIAMGVGFNYDLIIPDIADLQDFPLIKAATDSSFLGADPAPVSVFDKFRGSLEPMAGTHWGALGAEILVYGMVRGFALFILEGKKGNGVTDIAVLGLFQLQKEFKSKKLVSLELVVKVHIALETEMAEIRARFTDNSYILDKNCKVTGGLALCIWWGKSQHSGDWVFTIGGYHPRYLAPEHFPHEPRLGISFCPDPHVLLVGELYFAITPSGAMLGARAEFTFQLGPLAAWSSLWLDALLMWEPLYFEFDIGVEMGIRFTFWLFGEQTISLMKGLRLRVWGPDFGGFVEFKVLCFALTISFGQKIPPQLYWSTFQSFVTSSLGGAPVSIPIEDGIIHDFTAQSSRSADYVVEGSTARLAIMTQIPVKTLARFNGENCTTALMDAVGLPDCGNSQAEWESSLQVEVKDSAGRIASCFVAAPVLDKVPVALWNPTGKGRVGLNDEEFVSDAFTGFILTAAAPTVGRTTEMINLADMVRNQPPFDWARVAVPDAYPQPDKPIAVMAQAISSQYGYQRRHLLMKAMRRQGLAVPNQTFTNYTAADGDSMLLASPRINPPGR